jgi:acyl-coenzyme A synthetase/AMP-(fatty) acid ligase
VYKILVTRSSLSSIPVPSLKRAIQAGGHLEWAYVEKFTSIVPDVPFYVMYGQTEATARISCLNPAMLSKKKGSIGLPLDNLKIRIVDASGTVLPSQTSGTIQVRGPSVCSGYWKDPEATRTRFIDGWLHTNDFGRIDDDGFLWIEGRNEDFLKVRGKRLSYGEIEQKVLSINGVLETASCSIPHEEAGEAPAIFLVAEENMLPDELLGRIKASLPVAWTCDKILVVDQIPLTERGKLDRGKLRELLGAHEYS